MTEINFHITTERIDEMTLEQMIAQQELSSPDGIMNWRNYRSFLCHFMVDDHQAYLPEAEAIAQLKTVTRKDMAEVAAQFNRAWREFADKMVPPTNGDKS